MRRNSRPDYPKEPDFRRAAIAWFCAALAAFAQLYSPQALLPAINADLHVGADAAAWAVGATTTGVAIAVLPWVRVADLWGKIRTARIAIAASTVLGLMTPLAPDFPTFIALRFVCGILIAAVPALAISTLAVTVTPRVLGAAAGFFVSGNALGGLVGRVTAGVVADALGWRAGMIAVAILAAAANAVFLAAAPQPRFPSTITPILRTALKDIRNPGVATLLAQGFLLMGSFTITYNYVAFHLEEAPFNLTLTQISWLFLAYLFGAITSPIAWRIADRTSPSAVFLGSGLITLLSLGLMAAPSTLAVVIGIVLFTGSFFGMHGIASGLVGLRAGTSSTAPALYNLSFYIGTSFFSWIGGIVFISLGWNGSVIFSAAAIAAALLLAGYFAARNGGILGADRVR